MSSTEQGSTSVIFKSGQISHVLNVSAGTIRRWVHRYPNFFSDFSKIEDRYKVRYTLEDVLIIATIQSLSAQGNGLDEIQSQLEEGIRHGEDRVAELLDNSPLTSKAISSGLNPKLAEFELRQIRLERDQALETIRKLEEKDQAWQAQVQDLLHQMADLKYELGIALGELNFRRQADQNHR